MARQMVEERTAPLSRTELEQMNAYWRAANYLAVEIGRAHV
jgi:phosphoketolase